MNYLKVRSLYFIKGLNYEGAAFSLLTDDCQLTIFSKLEKNVIKPYAIINKFGAELLSAMSGKTWQRHPIEEYETALLNKYNLESQTGTFIQVSNRIETGVELFPMEDSSPLAKPARTQPTPTKDHRVHGHISYYEVDGIITGFLPSELEHELLTLEKKEATSLGIYLIKSKNSISTQKLASSTSIETPGMEVWLNKIACSASMEIIETCNDTNTMVNNFYSNSILTNNIDGLLLMQSLGHKTATPYVQFISLWIVLEKISSNAFKELSKQEIYDLSQKNYNLLNKNTKKYINYVATKSVTRINKAKFYLTDKFIISAAAAGIELNDETITLFRNVKKTRDEVHSSVCEYGNFPTESIFKLLRMLCS